MRIPFLLLLTASFIGANGQVTLMILKYFMFHTKHSHSSAVEVLRHHTEVFLQLVRMNDPENLFEMFEVSQQHRKEILRMSSIHLKFDVSPEDVAVWNLTEHPEVEGYVVVSAEGFVTYEKWFLIENPNSVTGWKVKNGDFLRGILCDGAAGCIG